MFGLPPRAAGHRALLLGALTLVGASAYLYLNHYPLRPPVMLPLTAVDLSTPFVAWTIWPYLALLVANLVLPWLLREREFRAVLVAVGVALGLNIAIWALFPTTYPRPPLPQGPELSLVAYRWLMGIDQPTNCFPSGHITLPAILVWGLGRQWPHARLGMWTLLAVSGLTILTTKQHYLWDMLAGYVTALLGVCAAGGMLDRPGEENT